jgi:NADH pyrophosphatase NudC (nudix superfamily)
VCFVVEKNHPGLGRFGVVVDARLAQRWRWDNLPVMDAEPRETSHEAEAGETCPAAVNVSGEYWRWCPRCGHELHNEKCKLRCPRCNYFMSCSDFD